MPSLSDDCAHAALEIDGDPELVHGQHGVKSEDHDWDLRLAIRSDVANVIQRELQNLTETLQHVAERLDRSVFSHKLTPLESPTVPEKRLSDRSVFSHKLTPFESPTVPEKRLSGGSLHRSASATMVSILEDAPTINTSVTSRPSIALGDTDSLVGSLGSASSSPSGDPSWLDLTPSSRPDVSNKELRATQTFGSFAPGVDCELEVADVFKAAGRGDVRGVRKFLNGRGDPNAQISAFALRQRPYTNCALLPIAAMSGNSEAVKMLLQHKADVESEYGFTAGSLQMQWRGHVVDATVPKGSLSLLKDLVDSRADPHKRSSNDANLVWQCCYFGQRSMLDYLLKQGVAYDICAHSQDIEGVSFSPLHISTLQGHGSLVETLLMAKASPNIENELQHTPLFDAICCCRIEIARLLVSHGAQIMNKDSTASITRPCVRSGRFNPLNRLFTERNPVLVHAVAEGLLKQEEQVKHLSTETILLFLEHGNKAAQKAILQAIFRTRDVHYRGDLHEKVSLATAFFNKNTVLKAVESTITFGHIKQIFSKRQQPDSHMNEFFAALFPRRARKFARKSDRTHHMVSVTVCESLVPDFHHDIRIIKVIKEASFFDPILETQQCKAIISICWLAHRKWTFFNLLNHVLLLLVFFILSVFLHGHRPCEADFAAEHCASENLRSSHKFQILAAIGFPFVIYEALTELLEFIVNVRYGWRADYLADTSNLLDFFRIALDAYVLGMPFFMSYREAFNFYTKVLFSVCCFSKWMNVLYSLTPFRGVGHLVMPLLFTLRDIGPFVVIMMFYMIGMGHAFLSMRLSQLPVIDHFLQVIDFGLDVEKVPSSAQNPEFTMDEVQTRIMHVIVLTSSFVLPIALMNTFIAAMVNSHTQGIAHVERLYQSRLAHCVFTQMNMRSSMEACRVMCRKYKRKTQMKMTLQSSSDSPDPPAPKFLWYCYVGDD